MQAPAAGNMNRVTRRAEPGGGERGTKQGSSGSDVCQCLLVGVAIVLAIIQLRVRETALAFLLCYRVAALIARFV